MNIVVFGASGKTGHYLVKQGLEQGHFVTAFVRNQDKLVIRHANLKTIEGNVSDYLKTEQAIKNNDAVLSAIGANHPFKYDQVIVDGMGNIIKVMESTGVERLIYLSALAVRNSRKGAGFMMRYIAPGILRTELAGHEAREKMIRQSKLKWTIVKAPLLTNGSLTKKYRSGTDIKTTSFIISLSRADVASFMLEQLTDNKYICQSARLMK